MNKKIKFLAPVLCGAILACNLTTISVQAQNNNKGTVQTSYVATSSDNVAFPDTFRGVTKGTFTPYFALSQDKVESLCNSTCGIAELKNQLIQQGLSVEQAKNATGYLSNIRTNLHYYKGYEKGIIILKLDGYANVFTMVPANKYGVNEKYTLNFWFKNSDLLYLSQNKYNNSLKDTIDMVSSGNITNDPQCQSNIARAVYNNGGSEVLGDCATVEGARAFRTGLLLIPAHSDESPVIAHDACISDILYR